MVPIGPLYQLLLFVLIRIRNSIASGYGRQYTVLLLFVVICAKYSDAKITGLVDRCNPELHKTQTYHLQ